LCGFPLFIKEAVKGYFLQKASKCTRSINGMPEGSTYWKSYTVTRGFEGKKIHLLETQI